MADFLLEIGTEEIPARMIAGAQQELQSRVGDLLQRERLTSSAAIAGLDTPRRLAVIAKGISTAQPDITEQINGPTVSIAFKDELKLAFSRDGVVTTVKGIVHVV